ncbi:MAG TPA: hypothetical protein VK890_00990 [Bacteroidia bacterium]|jgi:hypothetical protein|nr:hypothetical protein [Bacteroidia bacterium]HWY33392.1 hypothetical protein [Nitrosopumilaceae archaeon]
MTPYSNSFDHAKPFSDTGLQALVIASTALPWTIPGTPTMLYRAEFSASTTADVWVRLNGVAVAPISGSAVTTNNQERVYPGMARYVKGGDTLSFISTGTPQVGVSLLLVQST